MIFRTRPLTDRAWIGTAPRRPSGFTAAWSDTLEILEREVYALQKRGMPDPVLMLDITEADLRLDGQVRANARPSSDAVAISFESTKGPLIFRCDRFDRTPYGSRMQLWQHHVRAIALTLEALRKVERYGATQSDEQYAGWRQIEATPSLAVDDAAQQIRLISGDSPDAPLRDSYRRAMRRAHPDHGGTTEQWNALQVAARAAGLEVTS